MRNILIVLPFIFGLTSSAHAEQNIYSIKEAKDGRVFRLNQNTGEIYLITNSGLQQLTEGTIELRVGEYYEMELKMGDYKFLKYLGNGKFEKSKFALRRVSER
ncbi:MAG: hypothetical protein JAY74_20695 [Candidatus Thiodiazotropha taylori]|nr:hypothetical protein [Candidatus Thiodiazotropha taylori]